MSTNVLVAGAAGGIGSSVVKRVRAAGERAYGVDRDTHDIACPGGAEDAVAAAEESIGPLSGVVHAVGMSGRRYGDGPVTTCTDEGWQEVMRVNLESAFRLVRASLPVLARNGGGSIVLIGSALASTLDQDFLTVAYASAKSALVTLARSAAFTGAPDAVRVNVVAPGLVDTPMAARALTDEAILARLPQLQPLGGRAQDPAELADTAWFLLSEESRSITGALIEANRGWHLR